MLFLRLASVSAFAVKSKIKYHISFLSAVQIHADSESSKPPFNQRKIMNLYADMTGGVAGDMILGAMIDCGLPLEHLQGEIDKLNLPGLKITAETVMRRGVSCVKVDVSTSENHHHRTFSVIKKMIEESDLSDFVKDTSVRVFRRLAEAEGEVHQMPPDEVHFHEVGAADSIADIAGAAVGMEYFQAEGFYLSDFLLGQGTTNSAHGIIPVPAPATAKLLTGFSTRMTEVRGELTTPTGAAILTECSLGKLTGIALSPEKIGYGAGSRQPEGIPPYFRLWLFKDVPQDTMSRDIVAEANIDDMAAEMFPYLMDKLFEAGAHDVFFTPVYMKKRRPATMVTITAMESVVEAIGTALFRNSTTIGFRWYHVNRWKLDRVFIEVETPWGKMKAKQVEFDGNFRIFPEYEECRRVAEENSVPLQEVYCEVFKFGGK